MYARIRRAIADGRDAVLIGAGVAGATAFLAIAGSFQLLEWAVYDSFFRLRSPAPPDPRLLLVTIDEDDINAAGRWPLSDRVLTRAVRNLDRHNPAAIGIDLYRDLPVEPGYDEWVAVANETPNLVAAYKLLGNNIPPPPALRQPERQEERLGFIDFVLDGDGAVRRVLLSHYNDGTQAIALGFPVRLAQLYLTQRDIQLELASDSSRRDDKRLRWGNATFAPLRAGDGGYLGEQLAGYQVLLTYRGDRNAFESLSLTAIVNGDFDPSLVRDRVVIIGTTASSLNDLFTTPYSTPFGSKGQRRMSGAVIHANIVSQLLSAALDDRPQLTPVTPALEYLWMLLWAIVGATASWRTFTHYRYASLYVLGGAIAAGILLYSFNFSLFLFGWWVPFVAPTFALVSSIILTTAYHSYTLQRLVALDSLTQIGNRYACDRFFERLWHLSESRHIQQFCVILCDVDYFKKYNDTYGHQAGDICLQQVARSLQSAVRRSDFIGRYGGEEFVAVLPDTDLASATHIAQRLCQSVRALQIPHAASSLDRCVTLSCGVALCDPRQVQSMREPIEAADRALYAAKAEGRDRYCVVTLATPPPPTPSS